MTFLNFPEKINVHVHLVDPNQAALFDQLRETLLFITKNQKIIMADLTALKAQSAALILAVASENTVIDGAVVLIGGFAATLLALQQQLADAIAQNDPAAIQAVVDSMTGVVSDVNAKKQALADAVAANTPAAQAARR